MKQPTSNSRKLQDKSINQTWNRNLQMKKKVNRNSLRIHVEFDRKRTKQDRGKINSATKEEQ